MPNNTILAAIAWNTRDGYIACSGSNGLLRVLKIELQSGCISLKKSERSALNVCVTHSLKLKFTFKNFIKYIEMLYLCPL